jgi:hypothetical protein
MFAQASSGMMRSISFPEQLRTSVVDAGLRCERNVEEIAMTHILPGASYLRASVTLASHSKEAALLSLCRKHKLGPPRARRRIVKLLETPQTVETICRVLAREYGLPPQTCNAEVQALLAKLYEEDLIEVSPDT